MNKSRPAILVVTAGLMAMRGTSADRGGVSPNTGTFCVQWRDFCDKAQISTDDYGNTYGLWDWTCNGVDLTSGLGRRLGRLGFEVRAPDPPSFGTRPVAGGVPFARTLDLVFNTSGRISTLWGTDGVEPPFTINQDAPWTATAGPCDFSAVTDKPRMLDIGVRSSGRGRGARSPAAGPMATAATSANAGGAWPAGGTFCVQWRDFCDKAQISTDDRGNTSGLWDWTCNGVDLTSGLGRALNPEGFEVLVTDPPSFGTRPVAGGVPFAFTVNLAFDLGGRVSTLWATDGTSAPFTFTQDAPWTVAEGTCDFSAVSDNPPQIGRLR
jgi:hypothetical protein